MHIPIFGKSTGKSRTMKEERMSSARVPSNACVLFCTPGWLRMKSNRYTYADLTLFGNILHWYLLFAILNDLSLFDH